MTAEELVAHLLKNVQTFENPRVIGPGKAYHYTPHLNLILASGRFLGAPIDENLDYTQHSNTISPPAEHDPGVVFSYEHIAEAIEEGFGCDIVQIAYRQAVKSLHSMEGSLDYAPAPETIMILTSDIISFERVDTGETWEVTS